MKKYSYKWTTLIKVMFCVVFIVATTVIVLNIFKFINTDFRNNYSYITLISSILVGLITLVLAISMLISSYFAITNDHLIFRLGLILNKIDIKTITRIVKNEKTNKLIVYYNEIDLLVIFIDSVYFDEFTQSLLDANNNIQSEIFVE